MKAKELLDNLTKLVNEHPEADVEVEVDPITYTQPVLGLRVQEHADGHTLLLRIHNRRSR